MSCVEIADCGSCARRLWKVLTENIQLLPSFFPAMVTQCIIFLNCRILKDINRFVNYEQMVIIT
ncbi:hypothetical protein MtrunA17_Chr2g0297081 [Medicago truncatula]|uniref:Transmembrane protein n=1 Tax=Medicago truncatula TaxID=3880 RepID=A0A396J9R1_MEDTR|nr:hypothetical protein MtrunA17_Chr2g0297081 [Medicago truncatula]